MCKENYSLTLDACPSCGTISTKQKLQKITPWGIFETTRYDVHHADKCSSGKSKTSMEFNILSLDKSLSRLTDAAFAPSRPSYDVFAGPRYAAPRPSYAAPRPSYDAFVRPSRYKRRFSNIMDAIESDETQVGERIILMDGTSWVIRQKGYGGYAARI